MFIGESPSLENALLPNRTREDHVDYIPVEAILRTVWIIWMRLPRKCFAHVVKPFP